MINVFLNGWTLGIATGTTCLATCAPIYIPYLLTEERSGKQSFKIIALITLGRFFAYAGFGAIFGFVGSKIPIHSRQVFTGIAYILLSIYLVISVFR
ncbi:MAG: sulfite exporter TauE/SafE family protein, partial [Candidatus Cloacimonetes bacterium]|nr:sulfite exporter TauE/SafE family protein [Candidatus Cloacimonadota bacterium]